MAKKHKHCWHFVSGYTNGLATGGFDHCLCCHCGLMERREWTTKPDPKHGPHSPDRLKVYVEE